CFSTMLNLKGRLSRVKADSRVCGCYVKIQSMSERHPRFRLPPHANGCLVDHSRRTVRCAHAQVSPAAACTGNPREFVSAFISGAVLGAVFCLANWERAHNEKQSVDSGPALDRRFAPLEHAVDHAILRPDELGLQGGHPQGLSLDVCLWPGGVQPGPDAQSREPGDISTY